MSGAPTPSDVSAEHPQPHGSQRPWWKRKRIVIPLAVVVLLGLIGVVSDDADEEEELAADEPATAEDDEAAPEGDDDETEDDDGEDLAEAEDSAADAQDDDEAANDNDAPADEDLASEPDGADDSDEVTDDADFDAFVVEGVGDDVVDLSVPEDARAVATITHSGASNFAVEVDVEDALIDRDLLVNEIGAYDGAIAVNLEGAVREAQITADGDWAIEVAPLDEAATDFSDLTATGTGDAVLYAPQGVGGAIAISHTGESNFAVHAYGDYMFSPDLLVNEIGDYSGTVRLEEPTDVVTVTADGDWTIEPD